MSGRYHRWTEADENTLADMWPYLTYQEIAERIGCNRCVVYKHAKKAGLTMADKSQAYREKISRIAYERSKRTGHLPDWTKAVHPRMTDEQRAAHSERIRRLWAPERRRVLFGLPQKTRLRVRPDGRPGYKAARNAQKSPVPHHRTPSRTTDGSAKDNAAEGK